MTSTVKRTRIRQVSDASRVLIFDTTLRDLIAFVDATVLRTNDWIKFVSLRVVAGSTGPQTAALECAIDGPAQSAAATGNGPQAEVIVGLEEDGKTVNGQGSDADTMVALARAYIHTLNRLLATRAITEPAAISA